MPADAPPKPLFPPARVVPLGGGAKLVFCSGVTARGSAAAGKPVQARPGNAWPGWSARWPVRARTSRT